MHQVIIITQDARNCRNLFLSGLDQFLARFLRAEGGKKIKKNFLILLICTDMSYKLSAQVVLNGV
jgi:hypothetical protein